MEGGILPRNLTQEQRMLAQLIRTLNDGFFASLILNSHDPSRQFPLPGLYMPGLDRDAMTAAESQMLSGIEQMVLTYQGATGAQFPIQRPLGPYAPQIRGSTGAWSTQGSDILTARYQTFNGKTVFTVETMSSATGELDIFFVANPYYSDPPVLVFTAGNGGNYTFLNIVSEPAYTSNPFILNDAYVTGQQNMPTNPALPLNDNPTCLVDKVNYVFPGSTTLKVETLNRNAWLSTSYQTRNNTNWIHRFTDNPGDIYVDDPSANLGLLDQPVSADGAISSFQGQQWGRPKRIDRTVSGDAARWQAHAYWVDAWAMGAPWVRCVARTQPGGAGGTGPVQFSVTLHSWIGLAPLTMSAAGACPKETLPYAMPTWSRALRTRGTVFTSAGTASLSYTLFNQGLSALPQALVPNSPLTTALATNPHAVGQAIVNNAGPSQSTNWVQRANDAVNTGHDVLTTAQNAKSLWDRASSWIKGAAKTAEHAVEHLPAVQLLEEAGPRIVEVL